MKFCFEQREKLSSVHLGVNRKSDHTGSTIFLVLPTNKQMGVGLSDGLYIVGIRLEGGAVGDRARLTTISCFNLLKYFNVLKIKLPRVAHLFHAQHAGPVK